MISYYKLFISGFGRKCLVFWNSHGVFKSKWGLRELMIVNACLSWTNESLVQDKRKLEHHGISSNNIMFNAAVICWKIAYPACFSKWCYISRKLRACVCVCVCKKGQSRTTINQTLTHSCHIEFQACKWKSHTSSTASSQGGPWETTSP